MLILWIKWLHIIAIISWMAGVLYLYRLFIYHVEYGKKSEEIHNLLSLMEARLYRFITVPAMHTAWLAGFGLMYLNPIFHKSGWLHAKILFVVFLTITTIYGGRLRKRLAAKSELIPSGNMLRVLNEFPTVLMCIIVWLVLFKPF